VLDSHPRCPYAVRFGIGVCYYKLGNIKKARFAFQKVLKYEPNHSMANAAIAIVEMQIAKTASTNAEAKS